MRGSSQKPKTVPTIRYRILAIVFFLLAAGGLFLGLLIPHLPLVPDIFGAGIAYAEGNILTGSLFGYLFDVLKYYFTKGIGFTSLTAAVQGVLALSQALLIVLAVLLSLIFAIISLAAKKSARGLAISSGVIVAIAYLFPVLTAGYHSQNFRSGLGAAPTFSLTLAGDKVFFYFDYPLLIVAGSALLLLFITAIARRKYIGFINVIIALLLTVATLALINPASYLYQFCTGRVTFTTVSLDTVAFLVLIGLLALNFVLALARLCAKRNYPFDAVRYGFLFAALLFLFVAHIIEESNDRFAFFTESPILTAILSGAIVLVFILSICNAALVSYRRRAHKVQRISEELEELPAANAPYYPTYYQPYYPPQNNGAPYPPVIVLQMPPYYPMQAPAAPAAAPTAPVAPQVSSQDNLTDFERKMLALSGHRQDDMTDFERRMLNLAAEGPKPQPATQPVAPQPIFNPMMPARYMGRSDVLFNTLTEAEYTEFTNLFIANKFGDLGMPPYVAGADNAQFFVKFFANLARLRPLVSDGLLEKIYVAANKK